MAPTDNGWNEYSRLVLEQLEALSVGIDSLREEMLQIKEDMTIMKAKEDKVTELKTWKERIDEVTSPPQLKSLVEQVQDLKDFKTKAIEVRTKKLEEYINGLKDIDKDININEKELDTIINISEKIKSNDVEIGKLNSSIE